MALSQLNKRTATRALVDERVEVVKKAHLTLEKREDYVAEIRRLWQDAQERFILIGRYLVQAKQTLAHGEFQKMIAEELPFGVTVAYRLRTVAEAVDGGRLPQDSVPRDYTVAYELARMPDEQLELAKSESLVRPDVTRREVNSFRTKLKQRFMDRREALRRRREMLIANAHRIQEELRQIEEELSVEFIEGEVVKIKK
jgi:hypothetical protein